MSIVVLSVLLLFIIGYSLIIFEYLVRTSKAAIALLCGIGCWWIYFDYGEGTLDYKFSVLIENLGDISQLLFFLMGAITIVEIINAHAGFDILGRLLKGVSRRYFYSMILLIAFFLSSVLDNLTTLIVLVCLVKQVIPDSYNRKVICSGLVTAVNAGGAWTPIGDVTTTMLWIQYRITTLSIMQSLFIPSLVCLVVFGLIHSFFMKKDDSCYDIPELPVQQHPESLWVLILGMATLASVPILKIVFNLPPFMGILFGLGVLWVITDWMHHEKEDKQHLKVYYVLSKIDMSTVLFFLGILLAIDALKVVGFLEILANKLLDAMPGIYGIAVLTGFLSAIIDNVPLVAASIRMFDVSQFPPDHNLWKLLAFCAGTGGSMLIIGSAPGVALMSLEKISFWWYAKRVGWISLIAFLSGVLTYFFLNSII